MNKTNLENIIKQENPSIIHVHYASGYGTLGRLSINDSVPKLLSVYGSDIYDFPFKSFLHKYIIKKNLNFYNIIGSTSKAMANKIVDVNNIIQLNSIVITPFGVDRQIFFNKQEKNLNNSKFVIGSVKKLAKKYGIEYAIKSIRLVIDKYPELKSCIEYRIYGEGPQEKYLKKLVKNLGLQENIFFYGRVKNTEVPNILQQFDLFLAPSTLDSESFGVSVVEAMSSGIPVLASDVDGFLEVLDGGKCGMIVKRKDETELSEKIIYAINNKEQLNKYVQESEKKVIREYQWEDNVYQMIDIYKKMLGKSKK